MLNYFTDKTILITGASGYLGSHIKNALMGVECQIIAFDRKLPVPPATSNQQPTPADIKHIAGDIRDGEIWTDLLKDVDIVFHLAAQTSSQFANDHPFEDFDLNVRPALNFMNTCRKQGYSPDVVFAGTATQVGLTKESPVHEEFQDHPVTVYDIHKLTAEKYFKFYAETIGRATTLRLANLYGPGPKSSSADRGVLNTMVRRAIEGKDLTIYGDGNFIRDYVYVEDVCKAFLLAAVHSDTTTQRNFVIGSGKGHTFKQMVEFIQKQVDQELNMKINIQHVDAPKDLSPIEFRNFVADISAFQKTTDWKPKVFLEEGIERTMRYFLDGEKSDHRPRTTDR